MSANFCGVNTPTVANFKAPILLTLTRAGERGAVAYHDIVTYHDLYSEIKGIK